MQVTTLPRGMGEGMPSTSSLRFTPPTTVDVHAALKAQIASLQSKLAAQEKVNTLCAAALHFLVKLVFC